jgi:hypothetical protein
MNPSSGSLGLGGPILEQLLGHAAPSIATSQLVPEWLGLDEDAIGTLLEHDLGARG